MQSITDIRISMLRQIKKSLEAAATTQIIFKDGVTQICVIPFEDLELVEDGATATAVLQNSTSGELLAGVASTAGTADTFEIYGWLLDSNGDIIDPSPDPEPLILWGTVGDIGSGADIEFTRTEWTDETIVRISRLRVVLR